MSTGARRAWTDEEINYVAALASAVGEPVRVRVLLGVQDFGPITGVDLAKRLDLPQSTASRHLNLLARFGLVFPSRQANRVFYEVSDDVDELLDTLRVRVPVNTHLIVD